MHILVVEDQQDFAQNIKRYLETESYSVDLAFDGETGLQQALGEEYALVVLDLNLPRMDGLEVCRQLRKARRTMPVLMLTARIGHKNAVAGLDSGADDYLTKPFDLEELLARMRALLRRGGETRSPVVDLGDVTVDTNTHEVRKEGRIVALAPREYALLEFLALNRGIAKSRLDNHRTRWGSTTSHVSPDRRRSRCLPATKTRERDHQDRARQRVYGGWIDMQRSPREWHQSIEKRFNARFSVEQRLAMEFTRLVCVFVLISGVMFSAASALFMVRVRQDLNTQIDKILLSGTVASDIATAGSVLTASMRPYIRILAPDGAVLYAGDLFVGMTSGPVDPFSPVLLGDGQYLVVTRAVRRDGRIVGYVQFAGPTGRSPHEVGWKLLNLGLTTLVMGVLAYVFGLSFSRRTLRPVHESQERLEQFTQDASHELRTPLASISSSLDVAMKTGEFEQGIMAVKGQVKYASLLVERLLEVAQLERRR